MRFNAKELACIAQEKSTYFDFESVLFVKDKLEGIFKKNRAVVERLFRLKGNILFYFKGKDKSYDVAGAYVLERCCVQLEEDEIEDIHLYCFSIVFEGEPTLNHVFLGSQEEHIRDKWIELLHIASFECMKFQLDILRDQIRSKTGKDPVFQLHESQLALTGATNSQDITSSTHLQLGIQCKGLPLDQHGNQLDTFVTLHYFSASVKEQWVYHGRTEIIEKNSSPNFVSVITFRNFDIINLKTKLKLSLRVIKERMTNTAITMASSEFSLMEILTSPTMSASFTLRSSKYDEIGTVTLSLWVNCNSSNMLSSRGLPAEMDAISDKSKLLEELPAQSHLHSLKPCSMGIDCLFLTSRIIKTFRFPITGSVGVPGLLVNEHLSEFKHSFILPYHYLEMLIEDEKHKILSLRNLGKLKERYETLRSSIIDFNLSNLINYDQQLKFFCNKKDLSFKPSIKKSHKEVEFVPTNLHLHSMYVSCNIQECHRYDIITVGAFTAGAHKYKHGGVRRLALQLETSLSKVDKKGTKLEYSNRLLRLFVGLREEVFLRCDALCSSAVKGKIELVRDSFKILEQRMNKLLRKSEDEVVATGVVELSSAQFVSSPHELLHSFGSLKEAAEVHESDDEANSVDGSGTSHLIESWMWNGTDYVKGATEEPFDMVRLNAEASLVSLRSRLQELFQQSEKEAAMWLDRISPQVIALRKSVEMLVERSIKGLNFLIMQEIGSNLPLYHSLKCRRDVVFCQAITSVAAGFLSKLSCLLTSLSASGHKATSSSSTSSSSTPNQPHKRDHSAPRRQGSVTSSSSSSSLLTSSPSRHFFSQALIIFTRIGVLMQFESLLSCYGDEMCMLEDHSEAVTDLSRVKIRLKSSLTKAPMINTSAGIEHRDHDSGKIAAPYSYPVPQNNLVMSSSFEGSAVPRDPNTTEDQISLFSDSTNSFGEALSVVNHVHNSSSQMDLTAEEVPVDNTLSYQIVGNREFCEIVIILPPNIFEDVKRMSNPRNEHQLGRNKDSCTIQLIPVIFTIGINEQATLAERFFSVELQEELNKENFHKLNNYYKDFCSLPDDLRSSDMKSLNSSMQLLYQNIFKAKRNKNVDVLHLAADVCRQMEGIRYTSCKSAKDRTAMSVTLEEVTLLKREHDLSADLYSHALDSLRSEGVRRDNTYKNTGVRKYAFNSIQLLSIPKVYRPPKGTFGNLEC